MAAYDAIFAPLGIIEKRLGELCAGDAGTPRLLQEAMRYAVLDGGKRLRPLLCWHTCEAVGAPFAGMARLDQEALLRSCVALELVHAFSLVHDDLPALDNDDLRRGKPTLHRHAGEAAAILAGDALLTYAFCVLQSLPPGKGSPATASLAEAAWLMVRGQVLDTLGGFDDDEPARRRVRVIHEQKTGALIRAACRMGGVCGLPDPAHDPHPATMEVLDRFGQRVGLMYQIVDDLMDLEQSEMHAGKRTGKDAKAGKMTYPGAFGVDAARAEVNRLRDESHEVLAPLGARAENLHLMTELLATRTN